MSKSEVGQRKGYTPSDYRKAVRDRGSINGAANQLGVDRKTVRSQCVRHGIEVETIGGVPDPLPSELE